MNRILIVGMMLGLGGCAGAGHVCDEMSLRGEYEHVSHPFAGFPFGAKDEEDALHTIGTVGRCSMGRGYVELGTGYKLREAGFYGPELTGTVRVGVELWKSR